jgi:hypothetical protein
MNLVCTGRQKYLQTAARTPALHAKTSGVVFSLADTGHFVQFGAAQNRLGRTKKVARVIKGKSLAIDGERDRGTHENV